MIRTLIVAMVFCFSSLPALAAGDEEAIQKRLDEFVAAWNKDDAKAMAALWAPDGDLINPFGRLAKGRPEVEKLFIDEHTSFMQNTTYNIKKSSLRLIGSDAAVVDFDSDIVGMKAPDGSDLPPFEHHVTMVLTKKDGTWWVVSARPVSYIPVPGEPES